MGTDRPAARLRGSSLDRLPPSVRIPDYDRTRLRASIVHIGVGGFHRAHLATYVDELCGAGRTDWAITGAGVLPQDERMAATLEAQDHLYTLITRGPESVDVAVVGSIVDYVHVAGSIDPLVTRIADPSTQIVSLTITEGGYPIDDVTGDYRPDSPVAGPSSAFATIAAGLDLRRKRGGGGITVISCDNITRNGSAARSATLGEADRLDPGLTDWISASVAFPDSMVDRITPATTDADRAWLADETGILDGWPVVTEPFRQWVIEDTFAEDRLPLEDLDVITTSDVEPYEVMKLRLLNASHSCLAYLAAGVGIDTVDAAMSDADLRAFVVEFLGREARPVLPPVPGMDLAAYTDSIVERFENPAIRDQIARLCLDGSAKFPKFLLPTVRAQLAAGGPVALSALALAGWCDYLTGDHIHLSADPLLDEAVAHAARSQHDPVAFLGFTEVFGTDLARSDRFSDAFVQALGRVRSLGIPSAIRATLQEDDGAHGRSSR